jgi:hypothetical protein
MTLPNMKSSSPAPMTLVGGQTYFRLSPSVGSAVPPTHEALRTTDPGVAANDDDAPRMWYQIQNPLWVIVIGMAFLFAVMALIVALG